MKVTSPGLTHAQFNVLQLCPLFNELIEAEICDTLSCWRVKKYGAGAVVLLEGHVGSEVFVILEGRTKIYCCDSQGREMVIGYKSKGEVVGEMGFIDGIARSATVETITPSTLLWTNRDAFQDCCKKVPQVYENLLKIVSAQLRLTNARMQVLQASSAGSRVARLLMQLMEADASSGTHVVPFKFSQTEIGAMTGLSRASVNHVFSVWKQLEYISIDTRHRIIIYNVAALKREAQ